MIMPAVEKPHCSPCFSQKAFWMGCSLPSVAIPSIVLICAPSHCTARSGHDLPGCPFGGSVQGTHGVSPAPDVGAVQAGQLADIVDEQQARLDIVTLPCAVDGHRD